MKKFSLIALAAAGMLLGACSSDDVVTEGTAVYAANGEGYIGFQISLPSAEGAATRANDDFNNGTEEEFLVHSAKLFIFKGTKKNSEGNNWTVGDTYDEVKTANAATILQVQDFAGIFENDTQGAQAEDNTTNPTAQNTTTKVTTSSVAVAKIDKVELGTNEEIFGYVVINPGSTSLGSAPATGTTFATWANTPVEVGTTTPAIGGSLNGVISSTGMLMTNAPTSTFGGGNTTPSSKATTAGKTVVIKTAVRLTPESIKDNLAAARSNPAGCVYVERAAAKVTLTDGVSNKKITKNDTEYNISLDGWQVINTETSFYNVRKVDAAWNDYTSIYHAAGTPNYDSDKHFRFITKDAFAPTLPSTTGHNEAEYRTYFAQDPQYDADATLANTAATDAVGKWNSFTGRAYVPENTFDVEHQNWKNTTQVTVKVTVTGPGGAGADFVTLTNDDALYTPADAETKIQSLVSSINDVRTFLTEAAKNISHYKSKDGNQTVTATIGIKLPRDTQDPTAYDLTAGTNAYTASVSFAYTNSSDQSVTTNENDITANVGSSDPLAIYNLTKSWTEIKATIEAALTATVYKGGVSYYNARIQHFGEFETPWSASNFPYTTTLSDASIVENSTQHIYAYNTLGTNTLNAATQNFLGRYGVVRDNWYNLTITEIKKLGSAEPIDMSGNATADDIINEEYYISAHVHILPWVLRTQNVKF